MKDKLLLWVWMHATPLAWWTAWLLLTLVLGGWLINSVAGGNRNFFVPAQTTAGHHQIEQACEICHTPFGGVKQQACTDCHATELKAAEDSHPAGLFDKTEHTADLKKLDAQNCIACHREHRPTQTDEAGVSLPHDFCRSCHENIGEERESHHVVLFNECRDCHNYHDNRALNQDFLAQHLNEPDTFTQAAMPVCNFTAFYRAKSEQPLPALSAEDADFPKQIGITGGEDWETSSHAKIGVNCMNCHTNPDKTGHWKPKPQYGACTQCHPSEVKGFLAGKHGMRQAVELAPMRTTQARLAMHPETEKSLTCVSCHRAHRFNTEPLKAGVESCLACHADEHSQAYKQSAHFRLLQEDPQTGVSCATCHLPQTPLEGGNEPQFRALHNQNANLRPNQKMLAGVCMHCHGLGFSLNALGDKELIKNNFQGKPKTHVNNLKMVEKALQQETAAPPE